MRSGDTRREYERLFERLAALGMEGVGRFFSWTPREIEWEIRAFAAKKIAVTDALSALAWLMGGYVTLGVHAPGRYPKTMPGRVTHGTMTDEAMKQVFLSLAGRRKNDDA